MTNLKPYVANNKCVMSNTDSVEDYDVDET
jgi:predicted Zn-dependent protease